MLYGVLLLAAFITAYYTFRLYFRVFEGPLVVPTEPAPDHHGAGHDDHSLADVSGHASASAIYDGDIAESGVDAPHGETEPQAHDDHHHDHEPAIMMVPLAVLAVGALLAWVFNFPGLHWMASFLGRSPSIAYGFDVAMQTFGPQMTEHAQETLAEGFGYGGGIAWFGLIVGSVVSLAGIGTAYYLHLVDRGKATSLAHTFRPAAKLLEGKYFVDQIYDAIIVRPLRFFGYVLSWVDRVVMDGLVTIAAFLPWGGGQVLRVLTQRGQLQGYAVSMLFGIAAILLVLFL